MGDFRHVVSELSRFNRESKNNWRQGVPLDYSSRIKGKSVTGSRSGNRDEGVIMDMSILLRVGERKLSPGFTATKLLEVRRASTLLCSRVRQLSSVSISVKLGNCWYLPSAHLAARRCTISNL